MSRGKLKNEIITGTFNDRNIFSASKQLKADKTVFICSHPIYRPVKKKQHLKVIGQSCLSH